MLMVSATFSFILYEHTLIFNCHVKHIKFKEFRLEAMNLCKKLN